MICTLCASFYFGSKYSMVLLDTQSHISNRETVHVCECILQSDLVYRHVSLPALCVTPAPFSHHPQTQGPTRSVHTSKEIWESVTYCLGSSRAKTWHLEHTLKEVQIVDVGHHQTCPTDKKLFANLFHIKNIIERIFF